MCREGGKGGERKRVGVGERGREGGEGGGAIDTDCFGLSVISREVDEECGSRASLKMCVQVCVLVGSLTYLLSPWY